MMIRRQTLGLLIISLLISAKAFSLDFKIDGLCYSTLSDNTVELAPGIPSYTGDIIIPSYVDFNGKRYDVVAIGDFAFFGCSDLTSITIPKSVTSIGIYAFSMCSGLASVVSKIVNPFEIDRYVFSDYSKLTLTVPAGTKFKYESTCCWCEFTNIVEDTSFDFKSGGLCYNTLSDNTVELAQGSPSYTGDINIPNYVDYNGKKYDVVAIGNTAFQDCSGLTSVTIPYSVTIIGDVAFSGCSGLTSVIIPNSVTSIGYYAFQDCSSLTSITIPNSVSSIGDYVFSGCSGLTSVTIPNSVTAIGNYAFCSCSKLTSLTIPNTVTSIGDLAFYCCSALTSITIPNSVTSIGNHAFNGCSSLTSITIPNSVTIIENGVFYGCSSLTSITIPNSVTIIGDFAFDGCSGLTSIVSEIVHPFVIGETVFFDYSKPTLTVPAGTKSKYQSTNYWNKFTNIVEASSNIHDKDVKEMLEGCNTMKSKIDEIYSNIIEGKDFIPTHKSALNNVFSGMRYDIEAMLAAIMKQESEGLSEEDYQHIRSEYDELMQKFSEENAISPLFTFPCYIQSGTFSCNEGGCIRIDNTLEIRNEKRTLYSFYPKAFENNYDNKRPEFTISLVPDNGYRLAIFKMDGIETSKTFFDCFDAASDFVATFEHTGSNGIESVLIDGESSNIYNLQGKIVRKNAYDFNGLPKGVYIVNGRKVLVK